MDNVFIDVPLVELKSQYLSMKLKVDEAISRFLHSGSYVMGEEVKAFEREWADYCGMRHCVGVSSGTDALYLALKAVCIDPRVVTTPLTFFATTQAIIQSGNYPSFVDVDESGNLPPYDFGSKVAVPVHLYGRPGSWKGENLIEDCAQVHGYKPTGRAACFSFYPTKNLGAMGQAGAIVTDDGILAHKLREMRTYGERERFVHYGLTGNLRMDEIQAAILRVKLPHLDLWNNQRRARAGIYGELLSSVSDVIKLPEDHPDHVYHIYAIRCKDRDSLAKYLKGQGIQTAVRYPLPMHLQPALEYLGYSKGNFPQAEAWAEENLSLPMYPELTVNQINYVCSEVKKWVGARGK